MSDVRGHVRFQSNGLINLVLRDGAIPSGKAGTYFLSVFDDGLADAESVCRVSALTRHGGVLHLLPSWMK